MSAAHGGESREQELARRWGGVISVLDVDQQPASIGQHLEQNPAVDGMISLHPQGEGFATSIGVRPGLSADRRELFAGWVVEKLDRFAEHGPEPDGWQPRRSDGGWQLWARAVEMPPL